MKNLALKTIVKLQDRKMQLQIQRDEEGLTMLAYALGAAVIIVPLAAAVFAFGNDAATDAGAVVDAAIGAPAP
jgi:hypothetical protein